MKAFIDGFFTGIILQLAIGPLFFFILNISITSGFYIGLYAIFAVTLVDYLYIVLSILGIGKLLEKSRHKKTFGLISSIVLMIFGIVFIIKGINQTQNITNTSLLKFTAVNSFISGFVLTISSPLTIIFWGSVFTSKAVEKDYHTKELFCFGLGAGITTLVFLSSAMLILLSASSYFPKGFNYYLNIAVGIVITVYAVAQLIKNQRNI